VRTRWRHDERGQGLVEFALALPILLLIVTGLMDAARMVWQENTLAYAAREGTRYAIVHGSGSDDPATPEDPSGVADRVRAAAIGVRDITVTVAWPDTSGGSPCYDRGCRVSVDATAQFVPLPSQYLMGGAFRITLRGGSMLVIH
jgi:Flp pilus assembly protein TadG